MILSRGVRYLLRYVALGYLLLLLIVPVGLILWRTFAPGFGAFIESVTTPAEPTKYLPAGWSADGRTVYVCTTQGRDNTGLAAMQNAGAEKWWLIIKELGLRAE